jgi:class 3 adenylate cyclase
VYLETLAGVMPRAFVTAAVANDVLHGDWLVAYDASFGMIGLGVLLGLALATRLRPRPFVAAFLVTAAGLPLVAVLAFVHLRIVLDWFAPWGATLLTAAVTYGDRLRQASARSRNLREALDGVLPPPRIEQLIATSSKDRPPPREQIMTLMFIDVVGFSTAAEQKTPEEAFRAMKALFEKISNAVHRHDGIVDRSLGDGLLCYFGYRYEGEEATANHADRALACAAEIQRENVLRMLDETGHQWLHLPLRIGINTGPAYIGDLGDARRIDFTVIGHGVNYAQRLERASEINLAMLGASTYDLLSRRLAERPGFHRRMVAVKHHSRPFEAYEYNPFEEDPQVLARARDAYRRRLGVVRLEERFPAVALAARVTTEYGSGEIRDFSRTGIGIVLPTYLARSIHLTLDVAGTNPEAQRLVAESDLPTLIGEVRWGRPIDGGFLHGVLVKNLSDAQRDKLFTLLRATQKLVKLAG